MSFFAIIDDENLQIFLKNITFQFRQFLVIQNLYVMGSIKNDTPFMYSASPIYSTRIVVHWSGKRIRLSPLAEDTAIMLWNINVDGVIL